MSDINKENDLQKPFIAFSNRLAAWLLFNNVKLLRVRPDINDLSKSVYIFKNGSAIETLLEDYNEQLVLVRKEN
jgi:hypothetical protein